MPELVVTGGRPLRGEVRISGRKNAAVAILPAALLAGGVSVIENIPAIDDVAVYLQILQASGAKTEYADGVVTITPPTTPSITLPFELVKRMRASYYMWGVLLGRYGEAEVALPGGCDLGPRPVDLHLKAFRALGAEVTTEHGVMRARAKRLRGAPIYFDTVSVGATINTMLAACLAEGTTTIENAAKEPHIVDCANFLNACGARIQGAGTDVIKIRGVKELGGTNYAIIPDDIEGATFMIAAAATGGDVTVANVIPKHLDPVSAKLVEAGCELQENGDHIRVIGARRTRAVNIKTLPYPGFPTDAQPSMTALLSLAEGTSFVTETIFENRFKSVEELQRMGANIRVEGRTAIVEGVERLTGARVIARDLRAGTALIVAGLAAEGETEISGIEHVDRGYERMAEKLAGLGAVVKRT
ncbi:MAG: UDP-N-acetylglucosamine 1-carboxyvinyltransferase [Chloroflexota bacterium]